MTDHLRTKGLALRFAKERVDVSPRTDREATDDVYISTGDKEAVQRKRWDWRASECKQTDPTDRHDDVWKEKWLKRVGYQYLIEIEETKCYITR